MDFKSLEKINVIVCPKCHGRGRVGVGECPECRGFKAGVVSEGKFFYWGRNISVEDILARNVGSFFQALVNFLLGLGAFLLLILFFWGEAAKIWPDLYSKSLWLKNYWSISLVWWALLIFCFLIYRKIKHRPFVEKVDKTVTKNNQWVGEVVSWPTIFSFRKKQKKDIVETFTSDALRAIEDSIKNANRRGAKEVQPLDLFLSLLNFVAVSNVLARFGIPMKDFKKILSGFLEKNKKQVSVEFNDEFWQIIFQAYAAASANHLRKVDLTELIEAVIDKDKRLQDLLIDLGVNSEKLNYAVVWVRLQKQMRERWSKFSRSAGTRPKGETNRAMTALATPYLDRYSRDLTYLAARGALDICVGREKELNEIFQVFTSGAQGLVLVGPSGVGKRTIIEGVAEHMINEDVPEILSDKRLIELHLPSLLSGGGASEVGERLLTCLWEIERSGNIILVIPNIEQLVGITMGEKQSLDLADILVNEMERHHILTIATVDPGAYRQIIAGGPLVNVLQKVNVEEADFNLAVQVAEAQSQFIEYKNQIFFTYDSLAKAVDLATKFLPDAYLPASALELLGEAAVMVRNKRGKNVLVEAEDVAQIISAKVNVPLTAVTEEETSKLLRLEEVMHERVVGQDEAVKLVASAMRRSRVGVRNTKRPVSTFLFLGPTGVGKTETAKTLAEVYFGSENQMIRLDMSEYQDKNSIYRLIGMPGERASGILTEAVRQSPACLVLLDELEKADPGILNLFLQVLDDGRLTDSLGQVIDFTNTIIIATSNAGTDFVQKSLAAGTPIEKIREELLHAELLKYYRPEFVNRFDAVVLFKPLTLEDVRHIAGVILKGIAKRLKEDKEIELEAEDAVLDEWAKLGFDPQFGARPLRRLLQDKVEDKIAEMILQGQVRRNKKIIFKDGEVDVVDRQE